jgi:hypothetical protein
LDKNALGKRLKELAAKLISQAPKDIEKAGVPCAHVLFENLTANPIETVKEVYKQFNLEFTSEYEEILKNYLEENRKQREATKLKLSKPGEKKAVLHEHKPEDFGISSDELKQGAYAEYIQAFKITSAK